MDFINSCNQKPYRVGRNFLARHKGIGSLPSATTTACSALTAELPGGDVFVRIALYNPASATMVSRTSSTLFIWGSLLRAFFYAWRSICLVGASRAGDLWIIVFFGGPVRCELSEPRPGADGINHLKGKDDTGNKNGLAPSATSSPGLSCWEVWWTWSGSNRRPLPCHGSALPAAPQAHCLRRDNYFILAGDEQIVKRQLSAGNCRCYSCSLEGYFMVLLF